MIPKERAKKLVISVYSVSEHEQVDRIEQALVAAVEEEREFCAQLVDKQALGMQVLIDHAPTNLRREDLKRLKHSLEVAAASIRTRS